MADLIAGASVWEQQVYDYLVAHVEAEAAIEKEYAELASASQSPALAYLIGLILDDERRHHLLFRELAQSIRQLAEMDPVAAPIPLLDDFPESMPDIVDKTERFLRVERADAKELRRLAGQLHEVAHTTIWGLLVRLMQDDTAKHIRILEFIRAVSSRRG